MSISRVTALVLVAFGLNIQGVSFAQTAKDQSGLKIDQAALAQDIVKTFDAYCIAAQGDRGLAGSRFDKDGVKYNQLPDKYMMDRQGGAGGVGWQIVTQAGNQMLLEFNTRNICSIEAWNIEGKQIRRMIEDLLKEKVKTEAAKYKVMNDEKNPSKDADIQQEIFQVTLPKYGTHSYLGLSTYNGGPLDEHRAMLTYLLYAE